MTATPRAPVAGPSGLLDRAPDVSERIAARLLEHPDVAELHGGPYGTTATYLAGRRVVGVRVGTLEDGVRQLAGNVGYTVAVSPPPSGQAPAQVAVATGTVPIIQAFQALGEAAGTRAMVTVDPARRQVDVTYRA